MEYSQESSTDILIALLGIGLESLGWGMGILDPKSSLAQALSWTMIVSGSIMMVYAGARLVGRVYDKKFRRRECAFKRKMDRAIEEAIGVRRMVPRDSEMNLAAQMLHLCHVVADDIEEALGTPKAHEFLKQVQTSFSRSSMMMLGGDHLKLSIDSFIDEVKSVRDSSRERDLAAGYNPREAP